MPRRYSPVVLITTRIILAGVKGNFSKLRRRKLTGRRIYYTSEESRGARMKRKLLGKTSWYRGKKANKDKDDKQSRKGRGGGKTKKMGSKDLKTRAVIFVDQRPYGELAKRIRELLTKLEPTMGYRVKVVEKTGRTIQNMFSQTNIWKGAQCGRMECITCTQGLEELPLCTRSGIVYENICLDCNPGAAKKGDLVSQESKAPSL